MALSERPDCWRHGLSTCVICLCDSRVSGVTQRSRAWHRVSIMKSHRCLFFFFCVCTLLSNCASLPAFMPSCAYPSAHVCMCVYLRVCLTLKGPHSSSEAQWWPAARQVYNRAPVVWLVWSCVSSSGRDVKKCLGQEESNFSVQH